MFIAVLFLVQWDAKQKSKGTNLCWFMQQLWGISETLCWVKWAGHKTMCHMTPLIFNSTKGKTSIVITVMGPGLTCKQASTTSYLRVSFLRWNPFTTILALKQFKTTFWTTVGGGGQGLYHLSSTQENGNHIQYFNSKFNVNYRSIIYLN